jgi:hypothetical protein
MIMPEWTNTTRHDGLRLKVEVEDINWTVNGTAAISIPQGGGCLELRWWVTLLSIDGRPDVRLPEARYQEAQRCRVQLLADGVCEHDSLASAKAAAETLLVDAICDLEFKMRSALAALGEEVFRG